MKFALVVLVLLPCAFGASVDEKRFLESLFGGVDILDLAKTLLCQFATDETEAQCEATICPNAVDHLTHSALTKDLLCKAGCKEAQVLVKNDPGAFLHCPSSST